MIEYIYKITSPTGRIYIGRTKNLEERIKCYKYAKCKAQPKIYNSIKKYGWNLHKMDVILKTTIPIEAEMKLIEYYNSYRNGLNCTSGGEGMKMDETVRKKMSDSAKKHPSNAKGIKWSEESRAKLSNSTLGRPSGRRVPVLKVSKEGIILEEYSNILGAASANSMLNTSIANNLAGKSKLAGGFIWKYKNNIECV